LVAGILVLEHDARGAVMRLIFNVVRGHL
jgi:hypothetical protein